MKTLAFIYRFICFSLALVLANMATAQVNVTVRVLPPYQSRITEYASRPDLMLFTLTNTSTTALRIQLTASISGDNGVAAWVKPGYRSPQPIELAPGQVASLNGSDIAYLFDHNQIQYTGISQADFTRGQGLLEGTYQLCIRALDYDTHEPLSPEEPIGCTQFTISSVEPPTIIQPFNEQELNLVPGAQVFPITWSTPPGSSPMTQYKVKMVEMVVPRNPNDAMQSATTPPFFEETVNTNMLLYGPQYPQLTPGRQYALMVQAVDPFNTISFRNEGKSEVIMFSYPQPNTVDEQQKGVTAFEEVVVKGDTLTKRPVVVKGNLQYRFPESPEAGHFPLRNTQVFLEKAFVREVRTPVSDTEYITSWEPLPEALVADIPFFTDPMDGVTVSTDEAGNFEMTIGMTRLDSAGLLSDYHRELLGLTPSQIMQGIKTRGQLAGRLPNQRSAPPVDQSAIGIMYKLRVANSHYKDVDTYLRLVPGDTMNVQQHVVDANSYELLVNVKESFNGQAGRYVPGAKIRIYRSKADKTNAQLGIPLWEGDLLDSATNWREQGDKVLIAEAETPSASTGDFSKPDGLTVSFKRMFREPDQEGYRYVVVLENGSQVLAQRSFATLQKVKTGTKVDSVTAKDAAQLFAYQGADAITRLTLEKELLVSPRSKLTGKLTYKFKYYPNVPAQPYANMPVTLRTSDSLGNVIATTTTDAEGRFTFDFENVDSTYRQMYNATPGTTNQNGYMTFLFTPDPKGKRVYHVVPEVKYYAIPDNEILVQPWDSVDCGELTSMVLTYATKITTKTYTGEYKNGVYESTPAGDAEVLVLRPQPFVHDRQVPDLPGTNDRKAIQFSSGNALTNDYSVPGSATQLASNVLAVNAIGGTNDNATKSYTLERTVFTGQNGEMLITGLIPSVNIGTDYYEFRIGSSPRDQKIVSYKTSLVKLPRWEYDQGAPLLEQEHLTPMGRIQLEKDKRYDPDYGQQQLDPGGMWMMSGLPMNSLMNLNQGVVGQGINTQMNNVIRGGGRVGYHVDRYAEKLADKDWQAFGLKWEAAEAERSEAASKPQGPRMWVVGPVRKNTDMIFNKDLPNAEPIVEEEVYLEKGPWRVAGRVLDGVSKLGVSDVHMSLKWKHSDGSTRYTDNYSDGSATSDKNGDFVMMKKPNNSFTAAVGDISATQFTLTIYKYGYKPLDIDIGPLQDGKQFYQPQILLEPLGRGMYGYVVDADDTTRAVPARIKMAGNGVWVNTEAYTGAAHANPGQYGSEYVADQQRFVMDLPANQVKLVVMPYDRSYEQDTIEQWMHADKPYIGRIKLSRKKHKMRVSVASGKERLVAAEVTLIENGMRDTIRVDKNELYFEFFNNATRNFTLYVRPLTDVAGVGDQVFLPQTFTVENKDDGQARYYSLDVQLGRMITGKVTFADESVAAGAKVYLESGMGAATDNQTTTDEDGAYRLVVPNREHGDLVLRANYFEEGKTFVSGEKSVGPDEGRADLVISELSDIDISRLYGFKTRITRLSVERDGTYRVSGELYDVPSNANFALVDSVLNRQLSFTDLQVKRSALTNSKGIPIAVPVDEVLETDNREMAVSVNRSFNGMLHGPTGRILLKRASDTSGTIEAKVRIMDNSFEFPSSYMRMESSDFFLGKNGLAEAMPVFQSQSAAYARIARFRLSDGAGAPIRFKYLGFTGITEVSGDREAVVTGDTIRLFMNLSTLLPGNIPVTLKAGEARIMKGGVGSIITTDTLSFNLEKWVVKAESPLMGGRLPVTTRGTGQPLGKLQPTISQATWELSPTTGGLVLKQGQILTGKVNIPFKNLTIVPNEPGIPGDLVCNDLLDGEQFQNAGLTIGGIAKLNIRPSAEALFIYDSGVGRDRAGHYKLSIASSIFGNDYAASFSGLDGMTNPSEVFKIQIISLLSNREELFGFVDNQSITYYNQIKFHPKMISGSSDGGFTLAGLLDLGIPDLNYEFYEQLVYTKNGSQNRVRMPVLDFEFTGKGGARFKATGTAETQVYNAGGFVITGDTQLPGGVTIKGSQLAAMVTQGAMGMVTPNGVEQVAQHVEQVISRVVDVNFGLPEDLQAYYEELGSLPEDVKKLKETLINTAKESIEEEVTKLIPMGAQGALKDIAGIWDLGKQYGTKVSEAVQAYKDGDVMKLAGMMKDIPGMDKAIQTVENAVKMTANNALTAVQKELPEFDDVPVSGQGFETGNFEFDLANGRIFGSINFKLLTVGAVTLKDGGMEMLFDKGGWYFCSGATMYIPVPLISPLKVGLLIGNYGPISNELEARLTKISQSVSSRLPSKVKSGLSGFFLVGGKPIADVDIGFGIPVIAQFKLVASAGAEIRTYALFGQGSFTMGMGALVYGRVFASASALGLSVSGGAEVNAGIASVLTVNSEGVGMCIQGCASIEFNVEACAPIVGCASAEASITALVDLGIGSSGVLAGTACGQPGLNFDIQLGGGSCRNNPDFDF